MGVFTKCCFYVDIMLDVLTIVICPKLWLPGNSSRPFREYKLTFEDWRYFAYVKKREFSFPFRPEYVMSRALDSDDIQLINDNVPENQSIGELWESWVGSWKRHKTKNGFNFKSDNPVVILWHPFCCTQRTIFGIRPRLMWDNEGNGKLNLADFKLPISALEADWIREACLLCLQ